MVGSRKRTRKEEETKGKARKALRTEARLAFKGKRMNCALKMNCGGHDLP